MGYQENTSILIYGIINGLHVAAFLYVVLYFFVFLYTKSEDYRAYSTVGTLSFCFLCLSGVNLCFQYAHNTPITNLYPQWFYHVAKFSIPTILVVLTFLYLKNLAIKKFSSFHIVENQKTLLVFSYCVCLATFLFFFYLQDYRHILMLGLANAFIILSIFFYVTYKTIRKNPIGKRLLFIFSALNASLLVQFLLLVFGYEFNSMQMQYLQCAYGILFLWLGFSTMRYGHREITNYFEVTKENGHELIAQIYRAIRKQQFYIVYEPILNIKTNQICSMNALIRWKHPTRGTLKAEEFIQIADTTHMMHNIYLWAIKEIVQQAEVFSQVGNNLPISMALLPKNIHPKIVNFLKTTLHEHKVPASRIAVEITEDFLIQQNPIQLDALNMLRNMGVHLSLTNFGTGFSSLSHLSTLKLSTLKIDSSFIKNMDKNTDNLVLVKSTLQMAHGLHLQVIADGVDNDIIKKLLKHLDCDMIQGNVVAKPMRSSTMINWLHANQSTTTTMTPTEKAPVNFTSTLLL